MRRRTVELYTLSDGVLRDAMANADIVSEGKVTLGKDGLRYDGSTSILLAFTSFEIGHRATRDVLVELVSLCPHIRLRAIRIAHREASSRAEGQLNTLSCQIAVSRARERIAIDIEVSARIDSSLRTGITSVR